MKITIEIIAMSMRDPVTVSILLILALFSLITWGIIITKYFAFRQSRSCNADFESKFKLIKSFADINGLLANTKSCPLKDITQEIWSESQKLSGYVSFDTFKPRSEILEEASQRAVESCRLHEDTRLSFLAMASSVSPFFGLFGTVWGIMQSFYEIGEHGSADLSIVAPGIAIALITTVAGLIAAIPASMAYNYFVSGSNRHETGYYNFASLILSLFKLGDLQTLEGAIQRQDEQGEEKLVYEHALKYLKKGHV